MTDQAKITKKDGYTCCPEGHTPVTYPVNTIVTGQVAQWALDDKAAARMVSRKGKIDTKAVKGAPENKADA